MDHHFFNKTVWGLLLIGAGVLFLLNQTGAINLDLGSLFADYWPVILIFFGLKGIAVQRKLDCGWGGSYIWHVFITLLGTYFLLRNLNVEWIHNMDLWQFIVPVLLITIGVSMLRRGPGSKYEERRAAMKEQYRQEKAAYKEQRRREREAYLTQKYQAKLDRRYGAKPGADAGNDPQGHGPHQAYDPSYTSKIGKDLDQAFQERVVKKLGDDPFPLVSQTRPDPEDLKANGMEPYPEAPSFETPPEPGSVPFPPPPPPPKQGPGWNAGWEHGNHMRCTVDRSNFIGDIHLGQDYWELEPTNVSHFIGDTIIDLTKASIPYGETKITVSTFIGDVKVFVPNDIQVDVSVTASAFIGDMKVMDRHEGGFFRNMKYEPLHYREAEKKISLTVSMFIGDVFVKRVG